MDVENVSQISTASIVQQQTPAPTSVERLPEDTSQNLSQDQAVSDSRIDILA